MGNGKTAIDAATKYKISVLDINLLEEHVGKDIHFLYRDSITRSEVVEGKMEGVRKSKLPFWKYPVIRVKSLHGIMDYYTGNIIDKKMRILKYHL